MFILNKIIFPAPSPSYEAKTTFKGFTLKTEHPVLLHSENLDKKTQVAIYFHGNAQDLNHALEFMEPLSKRDPQIGLIIAQYPGYGLYTNFLKNTQFNKASVGNIKEYVKHLSKFVHNDLKIDSQKLVVIGRSIGSGPACQFMKISKASSLILISPFNKLSQVISQKSFRFFGWMAEQFNNNQVLNNLKVPTMVIHGKRDEVIPVNHSQRLESVFQKKYRNQFRYPAQMSHNGFDHSADIIQPCLNWMKELRQIVTVL